MLKSGIQNRRRSRSSEVHARSRLSRRALMLASLSVLGMAGVSHAQTANTVYGWTGPGGTTFAPTTGNWNTSSNWVNGLVPVSGSNTELDFGGSGSTPYVSTFDSAFLSNGTPLVGSFALNEVQLFSTATTAETITASAANASSNILNFSSNGSIAPQLLQNGTGDFNVNLGLNLANNLTIAGTGTGALNFNGNISGSGSLTSNYSGGIVTLNGSATFSGAINVGGTNVSGGTLVLGPNFGYNASAGGTINVGNSTNSAGTVIINSTGTINLSSGSLNAGGTNSAGAIYQNNGTVYTNGGSNYVTIGNGGYGYYQLSGGSLINLGGSGFRVGATSTAGQGVFVQTGGSVVLQRYLAVGASGSNGVATFTGGSLITAPGYDLRDGDGVGTVAFNVGTEAGGNASIILQTTQTGLEVEDNSGTAVLNLNAGKVVYNSANTIAKTGAGTGIVNFNGATLQANVSNATMVNNTPTSVNMYNGGLTVDTQGFNSTISSNILGTTGSGIYATSGGVGMLAVPAANGGSGYIGSPIVTVIDLTNSSATGATAVANISNGVITGVTMTSPGQGYSAGDQLQFNFSGGGAKVPVASFTTSLSAADLAANGKGTLTKIGSGTLALTGSSTFTGAININGGLVNFSNLSNLGNGTTLNFNGGGIQFASGNTIDLSTARTMNFLSGGGSIDTGSNAIVFSNPLGNVGTGGLTKLGSGSLTLNAPATYTGVTNVNAGTLIIPTGSGLASSSVVINNNGRLNVQPGSGSLTLGTSAIAVTVNGGGTLDMTDGATGTLNINSGAATSLTIGSATGTTPGSLVMELGSSSVDTIHATGPVSALVSGAQFNITPLNGATITAGNYTLINAASGLNTSAFSLYSPVISDNGIFDLSLANSTSTQEILTVSVDHSVLALYWAGNTNNAWMTGSNWDTDAGSGTIANTTPGAGTNVFFNVATGGNPANNTINLGGTAYANSVSFTGSGQNVNLASGSTLTIYATTAGGNALGNGINMSSGSTPVVIGANVILGGNQTWTNTDPNNALVVNGVVSGAFSLTQAGNGPITLAGANTFSGGFNTTGGTLNLNNASALGTGPVLISGPVTLDNTSGSPVTLSTANPQTWGSNFSFTGTGALNLGSGAVTLPGSVTITSNASTLTVGGTINDGNVGNTLSTAGNGAVNLAGAVTGAITLNPTGPGTVILSSPNNSFTGNINQTGGTMNFSGAAAYNGGGALLVAVNSGTAIANFNSSGTFTFNNAAAAGYGNGTVGLINQLNGTLNLTPNGGLLALGGAGYLEMGVNAGTSIGSYGSYVMAGGVLNLLNATGIRVGDGGIGMFTQTGGTINVSRYFAMTSPGNGANSGGESEATFTGGTFNVSAGYNVRIQDNSSGTSIFSLGTLAGGNAKINNLATGNGGGMEVTDGNSDAGGAGILNLNAGTLQLQSPIFKGAVGAGGLGTGAFVNLNGATIQAGASSTTLINNSLDAVQVYKGGVTFDSNGFATAVSANLLAAPQTGFYTATIPVPAGQGGTGYVGSPYVTVTGGSGNASQNGYVGYAATAVATVSNGTITALTITNPGQGYQAGDQLSFNFAGGTGSTGNAAQPFNYNVQSTDIANNNTGAVTKIGAGSLTLSGSSTYAGGTQVKAGTLIVGGSNALGTGPVTLANSTTLQLSALTFGSSFNNFQLNNNGVFVPQIGNSGTTLTLTAPAGSIANSAFNNTPVTINDAIGFTASFTYTHQVVGASGAAADGVTFTIENQQASSNQAAGAMANGGTGGSLGYASDGTLPGISNSVGVGIDVYHDQLQTGTNGVLTGASGINSVPFISAFASSNVLITYNGSTQTLTETITSNSNGASYSFVTPNIDIAQLLGGTANGIGTGYVGFTGATGAVFDTQTISNFLFSDDGSPLGNLTTSAIGVTNSVIVSPAASTTLQLSQTSPYALGTVGPISIGSGGKLIVTVGAGAPAGVTRGVLVTPSITLSNSASGTVDLQSNAIDISGQSLSTVNALAASGFNNGNWNGAAGIISSNASSDSKHITAVGVILNDNGSGQPLYGNNGAIAGTFMGVTPADNDVLVKFTYYGDANLDGKVDGSDYSRIDASFISEVTSGSKISGWYNGDFNYDGVVNGSDYTLMDNAFNMQGVSLAAQVSPTAQIAAATGTSAVPEPSTMGVIALGATGLLGRRKSRSNNR